MVHVCVCVCVCLCEKVQRAYEVLRDPQQRKLYDSGKILEESLY